jgi:hypothetical protein
MQSLLRRQMLPLPPRACCNFHINLDLTGAGGRKEGSKELRKEERTCSVAANLKSSIERLMKKGCYLLRSMREQGNVRLDLVQLSTERNKIRGRGLLSNLSFVERGSLSILQTQPHYGHNCRVFIFGIEPAGNSLFSSRLIEATICLSAG